MARGRIPDAGPCSPEGAAVPASPGYRPELAEDVEPVGLSSWLTMASPKG
jgi:hypothetical protein